MRPEDEPLHLARLEARRGSRTFRRPGLPASGLFFFTLSTDSYRFLPFLNVAFRGLAGPVGLGFLLGAVKLVFPDEKGGREEGGRAWCIVRVWLVLFAVVGAQTAWILMPFVGNPHLRFAWIRASRAMNVFEFVLRSLTNDRH